MITAGIAVDFSALRIRRSLVDAGARERGRVHVRRVSAAMADSDGMIRRGGVEIGARQGPSLFRLRVVVLEAENPLPLRRRGRARTNRRLYVRDRSEIAIDFPQMLPACAGW